MGLGGILLTQMVLSDQVFGVSSAKSGELFLPASCLELVMGLPSFFSMIVDVKGGPLKDLFPSLFALAVNKDALVADYCEHVSGSHMWSPIFVRNAFVDDITLVSFLSKLYRIAVHGSPHDSV